jgi:hypothetical protein
MNFSLLQWVSSFALDVLIKALSITYVGLLVTLTAGPIIGFVFGAILLSMFHFLCVFLASVFVDLLEQLHLNLSRRAEFLITLASANALFLLAFAILPTLGSKPGAPGQIFVDDVIVGALLAVTNILSMLIVAGYGRVFRRS